MKTRQSFISFAAGLVIGLLPASLAFAWDPSTTHLQIIDQAIQQSVMHLRWMDASEMKRGIFSPLRIDPNQLSHDERLHIRRTVEQLHASSGAQPVGGPGACPGLTAPADTNRYCVSGDLWEQSALQWLHFGVLVESNPSARLVHHFVDLKEPNSLTWNSKDSLSPTFVRRIQARHNGEPLAGIVNRTNFSGKGDSAISWLSSDSDIWRPSRLFEHLKQASLKAEQNKRNHHLAMAMIHLGALVHVLQDLTVPAHARSDLAAFYGELSPHPFDRGLALQEFARLDIQVRDTLDQTKTALPQGIPLAETLLGHLAGEGNWMGIVPFSAQHFLSSGTLPPPTTISDDADEIEAASQLLNYESGLASSEIEGAYLRPWPSNSGYLYTQHGRPLAAFERLPTGELQTFLDSPIYREQSAHLIPLAVNVTRSIFDLLSPAWPSLENAKAPSSNPNKIDGENQIQKRPDNDDRQDLKNNENQALPPKTKSSSLNNSDSLEKPPPMALDWQHIQLHIGEEQPEGLRTWISTRDISSGKDLARITSSITSTMKPKSASSEKRTILAITARSKQGLPIVIERLLPKTAATSGSKSKQ